MSRLLLLAWLVLAVSAYAHKPSDSYLNLEVRGDSIAGQWDIALGDLEAAVGLDADGDGAITWGELRSRRAEVANYATSRLRLESHAARCPLVVSEMLVDEHGDGGYAVLRLAAPCAGAAQSLRVRYELLFDLDAQHRGLLRLQGVGEARTVILSAEDRAADFVAASAAPGTQFASFVRDGVKHIAIGIDHILFLVALLLPAVLVREGGSWRPTASLGRTLWNVGGIVTAFTLAHSITLTAAALRWIELPSRPVEALIALSVLLTAADNIRAFLPRRRWTVAFAFGLLHGFGFASVLLDLGLPPGALALSLFGFNLGVELGQLALVLLLVPLAHLLREREAYRRYAVVGGSLAIAGVALGWVVERAGGIDFMPF